MSTSATSSSKIIAVFGLSLLLGVSLLLSTQWAIVSFRPNLVETDNVKSTADPRQAREHALQRQGLLRQTKAAWKELRAALQTVQPPEQWPDQANQQFNNERSASGNSLNDAKTGIFLASQASPRDPRTQQSQQGAQQDNNTAEGPSRTQPLSDRETARCRTVLGDWCQHALRQHAVSQATLPPSGNLTCPADCNGVGNCNAITGICDCPAGDSFPNPPICFLLFF